jgi:hypothetical protein
MRESPSPWRGFSPRLQSQADLLAKLRTDLVRLVRDPGDDYAAWDFFVTAEAMRDWNRSRGREPMGRDDPLLLRVSDVANHGKHYLTRDPLLVTVRDIGAAGAFDPDAFDPAAFDTVRLVIATDDEPGSESAVDLARRAVEWWDAELRS